VHERGARPAAAFGGLIAAVILVVAACGGSAGTASSALGAAGPSASARIGASATPGRAASPKPSVDPNALGVKVASHTKSVRRGGTSSLTATTTAGADCGISVDYPAGPSTARGLEPAKADRSGSIVWSWKVAGDTPKGTWPIVVSCTLGDRYGETKTTFAVK
jgi:hypothetical protein